MINLELTEQESEWLMYILAITYDKNKTTRKLHANVAERLIRRLDRAIKDEERSI